MSERFCGVAFIGLENVAVNAFDCLEVAEPLLLLQNDSNFGIVAHGAGTDMTKYENAAKAMSKAVDTLAIVMSCSTSGYSAYQLFQHGRAVDHATFAEHEDDSQMYRDIGIGRSELAELFLAHKIPISVNPLGIFAAIELVQNNGWQGSQLIPRITRLAELTDRLIEQCNYMSASKVLKDIESQLKTLNHDRHIMFLRSLVEFHQSAVDCPS